MLHEADRKRPLITYKHTEILDCIPLHLFVCFQFSFQSWPILVLVFNLSYASSYRITKILVLHTYIYPVFALGYWNV